MECFVEGIGGTEIVAGSYAGDNAASRTITLGFTPTWVLVLGRTGITTDGAPNASSGSVWGGLAVANQPTMAEAVKIAPNGFSVAQGTPSSNRSYPYTNANGYEYNYIAGK